MIKEKAHIAFEDLLHTFEYYGDRVALIDKSGKEYTYDDLRRHIVGTQAELVKKGVKKGDKVLVFVPMSLELYAILEALFSLNATAIFLDPWMKGKKMGQVIKQVKPDLFIVTKKISRISWILTSTWTLKKWKINTVPTSDENWEIEPAEDEQNALITFTSGTSGKPKGANRTFGFLHAQAATLKSHLTSKDEGKYIDYTNFPIVGLADFAMGNTVVIPRINLMKIHKAEPSEVVDQLIESKVNRVIVSPALLYKITEAFIVKGTGKIKEIVTGGAPISNSLIQKCLKTFPDIHFEAIYGSTEAEPICLTTFKEISAKLSDPLKGVYVGKPVDDIELKILDFKPEPMSASDFEKLQLKDGEIGEIVVTGNHVNKNYYQNEEAFKKAKIIDNEGKIWHRTGDIGYMEKGELYLVGRDHRIMKHGDKQFYPYPLEQYIEVEFGHTDIGYVKKDTGEFTIYIGPGIEIDELKIRNAILATGYPIDKIVLYKKPLPRDARHKSKLQTEKLVK